MITLNSQFDSGAIVVDYLDKTKAILRLRGDNASPIAQWFAFDLNNSYERSIDITIIGLESSAYPSGWSDYRVCFKTDADWIRKDTHFDGAALRFKTPESGSPVRFAYFPLYQEWQENAFVASAMAMGADLSSAGTSVMGNPIHMLRFGSSNCSTQIWLLARQHPGETQGSYWMEGAIQALDVLELRELWQGGSVTFYLVPNVNPDGARLGNLRTNSVGCNLNRFWSNPSSETPEIAGLREKILEIGATMVIDVHADEVLPYVFSVAPDGARFWTSRLENLRDRFDLMLEARNEDFQTSYGYSHQRPGHHSIEKCTPWAAREFDCLSLTIEMPFKDNVLNPNPMFGWSPLRSRKLGEDCVYVVADLVKSFKFSLMS